MYPAIQAAVAAQHVKDMLDQAAQNSRAREARLGRAQRRARRADLTQQASSGQSCATQPRAVWPSAI